MKRPSGDSSGKGHWFWGGPIVPTLFPVRSTQIAWVSREPADFT